MSYNIGRWQDLWVRMCSLARRTGGWTWIVSELKKNNWMVVLPKMNKLQISLTKMNNSKSIIYTILEALFYLVGSRHCEPNGQLPPHPKPSSRPLRQVIFSRGEPCTWLGLLLAGRCQAFLPNGKNELRMGEHLPGEPLTRGGVNGVNTKRDINIESA